MTARQSARLPLPFFDRDPSRARLHREIARRFDEDAGIEIDVTAPATANQEFAIRHPSLGHPLRDFSIIEQDVAATLYRSRPTLWTDSVSLLKCSAGGARLRLRLR